MRKYLLFLGIMFLNYNMMAQTVSLQQAAGTARSFMMQKAPDRPGLRFTDTLVTRKNGINVFFTFKIYGGGFIIISASEAVPPVLGFSIESSFDNNNIPPNVAWWLDQYSAGLYSLIISENEGTKKIKPLKNTHNIGHKQLLNQVAPLCSTKWDQGCFYDEYCPFDTLGPCNHSVTGCVATAMAQIMKRWNYPPHGDSSHSYVSPYYGTLSANFGSTTYLWGNMTDSLTSSNPAVATLMSHCGIAVNMQYASTSSGAYISPVPFKNYFRYSQNAAYIYKYNFDSIGWINRLKKELDGGRPILYAGYPLPPMPTGHAWVCDGYDNNDYFHFNWGWSGTFNGYFQMWNFVYSQQNMAVVNIMPVQACDITVKTLVNPVTATFTGPEYIRVRVANYDTLPHSHIPVAYRVDNGPAVTEMITDTIPALGEKQFQFAQTFNFSGLPGHTYKIDVYSTFDCDAFRENDTLTISVQNVECSTPPYTMGFEPNESLAGWKIDDANADGVTWYYGSQGGHSGPWCAYMVPGSPQADDWLISKCISLEPGKLYKLSFWYVSIGTAPQDLSVFWGTNNSLPALDNLLIHLTSVNNTLYQQAEAWFTVPLPGSYYFGWYCHSGLNMLSPVIDDISIVECNAPDAGITYQVSPTDGCDLQMEPVSVNVKNYCSTVLSDIPVYYSVDGGTPQHDTIPGPIPIGGSVNFTFSVAANLAASGTFHLKVFTSLPGDTLHMNDTVSFNVTNVHSAAPPYSMGFESNEDYSRWVIENVNGDAYTWSIVTSGGHYGPCCARYDYSSWIAANDWIITKCIHLHANMIYRLGFWRKIEDQNWPENMAVYIGNSASSASMNTLLLDLPGLTNSTWAQSLAFFTVANEGYYYIGWKCYSAALMFNLYLDDILLEEFTTGIGKNAEDSGPVVFPNPGNGKYTIICGGKNGIGRFVEVYNTVGSLIKSFKEQNETFELDLRGEPSGLYLLRILTDGKASVVIVEKWPSPGR